MKKSTPSEQDQRPKAAIRCFMPRVRPGRAFRLSRQYLPAAAVVLVLATLVLYLVKPQDTGLAAMNNQQAESGALSFAEPDLNTQNMMLLNRGVNRDLVHYTQPSADPGFSGTLESGPAAETAVPETTATAPVIPEPTPDPRVFDANGIPQEILPVSAFTVDNATCYVMVNQANMRALPGTSSDIIVRLFLGDQVVRLGYGRDWSQVKTAAGKIGYVLSSLITTEFVAKPTPIPTPTPKPTAKPTPKPTVAPAPAGSVLTDAQMQAIVDLAKSCLGIRYVYGAESPSQGFDCSGLTLYIYKTLFGITLPRSARSQAGAGIAVSRANIQIGDIICFDWDHSDGVCDHVGIYIGGGEYIHAAHSRGKVVQSTLKSTNPVVSVRRIIH